MSDIIEKPITELDRFSNNLEELLTSIAALYSDQPMSINVRYWKPNATEPTIKLFKNPAQYKSEILDVFTMDTALFFREVYIDSENGDDSNTGNGDEPVATIREAFSRLNNATHGRIIFANDYEWKASEWRRCFIKGKHIELCSSTNNNDVKLTFNINEFDYDTLGCMIEVFPGSSLTIGLDIEVFNNYDGDQGEEIKYAIGLNGGSFYQSINYGKLQATNNDEATVITCNDKAGAVYSLGGAYIADYLKATMNNTDTSRLIGMTKNPTSIIVKAADLSSINGENLLDKGILAKWVITYLENNDPQNGFILSPNDDTRAINAVCRDEFLQKASE